jgi:hypothetical protein
MNLLCEEVRFRVDERGIKFRVDEGSTRFRVDIIEKTV